MRLLPLSRNLKIDIRHLTKLNITTHLQMLVEEIYMKVSIVLCIVKVEDVIENIMQHIVKDLLTKI